MAKNAMVAPADPCDVCTFAAKIRVHLKEADSSWRWAEELTGVPNKKIQHLFYSQSSEPFCMRFKSELRWAQAVVEQKEEKSVVQALHPETILVYMAHPVNGDFHNNIARAKRWLSWCNSSFAKDELGIDPATNVVVVAPWLADPKNIDHDPEARAAHMKWCTAASARCDETWFVGGRISKGMSEEGDTARATRDLTGLGDFPPHGY